MRVWQAYKATINKNCQGNSEQLHGLLYWSNKLFATIMIYLFPLFIIALIPGVYMSVISHLYVLASFDTFVFFAIAAAALVPGISIKARKSCLIGLLYLLAIVLLFYLGWYGPGMIYLLSLTIFCLLIFHGKYPFCTVYINIGISVAVAVCIHFNLLKNGISLQYSLGSWIAVSSNLIILSAVIATLLPKLFNGLQQSNDRYEIVAEATNDTIWDWDLTNNTILYNYGINLTFGYSINSVTNAQTWWNDKLHADDRETVKQKLSGALKNRDPHLQLDYRFLCADGTYKHVFDRAIIVRDANGDPIRMIGAMQDVTQLKNYVSAIEKQNTQLKEIAWTQAHVVRKPVARIMALADLLGDQVNEQEENAELVKLITLSTQELDRVIREIVEKGER